MGGLLSFRLGADSALCSLLTPDRRPLNRGDAIFTHVLFVLVATLVLTFVCRASQAVVAGA